MTPRLNRPIGLGSTLLLASLFVASGCRPSAEADASPAEAPPLTIAPENVTVVSTADLRSGPTISGTLTPTREATIRAELSGPVTAVLAEEGQAVAAGATLLRLDDTAIREQARSAESAVRVNREQADLARRNLARSEQLAAAGALSDQAAEQARATLLAAEAGLADAESRLTGARQLLEKTVIRAPFTGVVSARAVNQGDIVQPGGALVTVVDPGSMELEAAVPLEALQTLRRGSPVDFTVPGYEGRQFTGTVARINPTADPLTRQVRISVAIPNVGGDLVGGLFAQGRVATASATGLAVPFSALDLRGSEPTVTVLRQGLTAVVVPRLGIRDEALELVEVLDGLVAGDTVLLGAARGIAPATSVRVGRDR
ncbi:MAG TPA: efflux RND transporter periplasmic adaptor subunit [Gemmatimonadales bacterium]|nr:efflux RND transporter periplasmic adaptor subunit [Gemmatimonadales bacterium]